MIIIVCDHTFTAFTLQTRLQMIIYERQVMPKIQPIGVRLARVVLEAAKQDFEDIVCATHSDPRCKAGYWRIHRSEMFP